MITIISGTNRNNSKTLQVAQYYYTYLQDRAVPVKLFSLEELQTLKRNEAIVKLENELLIPSEKFIFIMPEYNGSFPGVLKILLDITDIRKCWWHKKILLTGLADGRGGNLRGLEHMTNILHYLKMNVYYNKLPISKINEETDPQGQFLNPETRANIANQIEDFLQY
jgi:chromate reductase